MTILFINSCHNGLTACCEYKEFLPCHPPRLKRKDLVGMRVFSNLEYCGSFASFKPSYHFVSDRFITLSAHFTAVCEGSVATNKRDI